MHRVAFTAEHGCIDKANVARRVDMRPRIVKHGIGPRGNGGERANAQRQGEHGGECESGRLAQLPQCVANILPQTIHRVSTPLEDRAVLSYSLLSACMGSIEAARRAGMTKTQKSR